MWGPQVSAARPRGWPKCGWPPFGADHRHRVRSVCKNGRLGCDKPNIVLQREVAKAELFCGAKPCDKGWGEGKPRLVTTLSPIQKLCGERPIL